MVMKFSALLLSALCVVLLVVSCSKDDGSDRLSDEEFREVYAEIVYLGELYRADTLRLRAAVDSLLEAYDVDTAALFAAARRTAQDKKRTETLYRETIERFERMTAADSLRGEADDSAEQESP